MKNAQTPDFDIFRDISREVTDRVITQGSRPILTGASLEEYYQALEEIERAQQLAQEHSRFVFIY